MFDLTAENYIRILNSTEPDDHEFDKLCLKEAMTFANAVSSF